MTEFRDEGRRVVEVEVHLGAGDDLVAAHGELAAGVVLDAAQQNRLQFPEIAERDAVAARALGVGNRGAEEGGAGSRSPGQPLAGRRNGQKTDGSGRSTDKGRG